MNRSNLCSAARVAFTRPYKEPTIWLAIFGGLTIGYYASWIPGLLYTAALSYIWVWEHREELDQEVLD